MKLSVIATKYSWLTKNKEPQAKNIGNPGGRGILCLGNPDGREGGGVKKCCHPWGRGWIFSGITHFTSEKKQIMHDLFLTIES